MKKTTISVTEAARNFTACVNRVRYQDMTFVLLKNGLPVARLVPESDKVCLGRELADALEATELPVSEARSWRRDLQCAQRILRAPARRRTSI
jgi:antitoxin (DNA-binding transcriptional repressor) of toxin-antitoxin stability system